MQVIKRDGTLQQFNALKIQAAIGAALRATGGDETRAAPLAQVVVSRISGRLVGVEEIQDLVERVLCEFGHFEAMRAYIVYREQHAANRDTRRVIDDTLALFDGYLERTDWRVHENANRGYSLPGLNNAVAEAMTWQYWLNKIYPPEIRQAHESGVFHIHDLGILASYCVGWDLYDLLVRGFGGVPGHIQCKPPKHFRTALGQIVNFLYTLQGESAGAQALSNFDTLLAPFVKYDHLDYREVKQAMQEFIFSMNVPTRVGGQVPFSNLSFDLTTSPIYAQQPAVIFGIQLLVDYAYFQPEMDMINRAFCEVMSEGDAQGRVFTFPIPTYAITPNFDWQAYTLEPLWKMTAKYGLPYFANYINSDLSPEDARSMCCRLRLDVSKMRRGGIFASNPLTGSVGVCTLNMPHLAYQANGSVQEFYRRIDDAMNLAKESLEIKRKVIERFTDGGLYPYTRCYLQSVKEATGEYWTNHFSTIGLVGMHEALLNLGIAGGITSERGRKLALDTLSFMQYTIEAFSDETGHFYNVEATPAEGASYRLARLDQERWPDIITAGVEGAPYYTNSTQLPVGYTDDLFEALEHQDDLQTSYTGGTALHLFLGEQIDDWRQARDLVRRVFERYNLPYLSLSPTFSICPIHGFLGGDFEYCPYAHSQDELEKYGVEYVE